jgi:uncharacterized membrane protein
VSRQRLEAFSDGVLAVAITLLVLELVVPPPAVHRHGNLAHDLVAAARWPHYVAFVVSFITVGIIWINHHAMIRRLRIVDHTIMIMNLLLLMSVVTLPYTTNLAATYLTAGYGGRLAAGLYSGSFLLMSIAFGSLQRHILFRKSHMLAVDLDERRRRLILIRGVAGLIPYLLATILAVVSAYASIAICAAVAFFYALPLASGSENASSD